MKIKIGTRKSKLALAQTEMVISRLHSVFPEIETEIINITTRGDRITDRALTEIGGKGVFIAEIERALIDGEIDLAVHSAKDLPVQLAGGTGISAVLERGNPRDVLITRVEDEFDEDESFTVGTGSLRRRSALSQIYPNVKFADIRGNIDTRLRKLKSGEYDAIVLASAGIERLGLNSDPCLKFCEFTEYASVPAPCQGIIAVQSRNGELLEILTKINHDSTYQCFETEREVIKLMNADCTVPVGAYSYIEGSEIRLTVAKGPIGNIIDAAPSPERFLLAERLVKIIWAQEK